MAAVVGEAGSVRRPLFPGGHRSGSAVAPVNKGCRHGLPLSLRVVGGAVGRSKVAVVIGVFFVDGSVDGVEERGGE